MGKTPASFDLSLSPPRAKIKPFRWLYDELRAAVLDGRLGRGVRLPSTRDLAIRCGVARGTVVNVFEQLRAEGYVVGKVGAGTYVSAQLPEDFLQAKSGAKAAMPVQSGPAGLSQFARRLPPAPRGDIPRIRAFRIATPAIDCFPLKLWAQIASRRMRNATRSLLADDHPAGYLPLRQAIAAYLGAARGARCAAEQVVILAGIQQAPDVTSRLLLDSGDVVCVEEPCFPGVAAMFTAVGARVVHAPVDDCGLSVRHARSLCSKPRLIYVTPAHQFPLGMTMTAGRRLELLDWARRAHAFIFEDDYDSEYRYSGHPIPALQDVDQNGSVILAGSFGKLLFPSLRLGYAVVPPALLDKFVAARFTTDRHSAVIDQAILLDFIAEGHFARHIRRMRELYASRMAVLRDAVRRRLAGAVCLPEIEAGVHTPAWLSAPLSAYDLSKAAAGKNVEALPLGVFASRADSSNGLLLGFGAVDERELRRGVDVLATVIEGMKIRPSAEHAVN
jgi:GntR family transcriptional regulator/MocR family aminotransferase